MRTGRGLKNITVRSSLAQALDFGQSLAADVLDALYPFTTDLFAPTSVRRNLSLEEMKPGCIDIPNQMRNNGMNTQMTATNAGSHQTRHTTTVGQNQQVDSMVLNPISPNHQAMDALLNQDSMERNNSTLRKDNRTRNPRNRPMLDMRSIHFPIQNSMTMMGPGSNSSPTEHPLSAAADIFNSTVEKREHSLKKILWNDLFTTPPELINADLTIIRKDSSPDSSPDSSSSAEFVWPNSPSAEFIGNRNLSKRPMVDMESNLFTIPNSMATMGNEMQKDRLKQTAERIMTSYSTEPSTSAGTLAAGVYNSGGEIKQSYNDSRIIIAGNNATAPDRDHNTSAHLPSAAAVAASQIGHLEQYFINSPFFGSESKYKNCQKRSPAIEFGVDFDELLKSGSFGTSHNWSVLSRNIVMYNVKPLRRGTDVYRGYQKHMYGIGRDLAIKFVKCTDQSRTEIRVLLKLEHHPNIVKIIDSGEVAGAAVPQIFIALEFCHQNVEEYINENPVNFAKARSFFYQAVSAITYIHSKNIIHRDLKPSNILVSWDEHTIKVSDFGISRDICNDRTRVTVTNAAAGSEGFKAPETFHTNKIGYKSDIFCLGLNGHYIVTHGRHPFGQDPDEWTINIKKNQNRNISLDSCFPGGNSTKLSQLEALFWAMLARDPNDRPTAQQVKSDQYFQSA